MQLALSFVASLIAASGLSFAAPTPAPVEPVQQSIALSKRGNLLVDILNSTQIDWLKVDHHLASIRNKYANTLSAYKVNTGKDHPLKRGEINARRATGSLSLTDESEQLWHGEFTFGDSTIAADFDTGSADTVCNSGSYKPGSSSTNTGKRWQTSYGDGTTASGTVYTDSFSIAGISASDVAIGLATSKFLDSSENDDCISGMSFPALAQFGSQYPPFFDSLMKQGKVDSGLFTFTLKSGSGSTLSLGAVEGGSPTYSDVDSSNGFWQVPASVNGVQIESIVDTGTTVIVAPVNDVEQICDGVDGGSTFSQGDSTYCQYDCNSPPTITFSFDSGFKQSLSKETTSFGTNDGQCVLSIIGEDVGVSGWVTGDSFLQNVHATFNRDSSQVGFTSQ